MNKLFFHICVFFIGLFALSFKLLNAQCISNIDFNTWSQAGYVANGNWAVQNGGTQVHQTVNGNPTFFISPNKLMCVKIVGDFRTENNDDDFMGFVFSFLNPIGESDNYNGWLFDWKQVQQASGGYTGQSGKALSHMRGTIPSGSYSQIFWGHQNTPEFTVVDDDFGGAGWTRSFNHHFELRLSYTHATIFIDGDSVFDHDDCYLPGYFGFYNYSQPDCYYSNFNFEPYVHFSVLTPEICPNDTAKFRFVEICQDSSLYDFSSFQSLTWDFGDGNVEVNNNITIQNINPHHVYTQPGVYSVILSLQDNFGCIGKDTQQIIVDPLPVANYSVAEQCANVATNFNDLSSAGTGTIVGWKWNFGDGSATSTIQSPSHTYVSPSGYSTKLVITTATGCKDSVSIPLIVHPIPIAEFNVANTCDEKAAQFTNFSNVSSPDSIQTYSWNFGDGSPILYQQQVIGGHLYSSVGTDTVKLVVISSFGCSDSVQYPVIIHPKPVADFGSTQVCLGSATVFSDSSTTSGGTINVLKWNFNDGSPNNLTQNPSHTFTSAGINSTTHIVQNSFGCADTITKSVIVNFNPIANFTAQDVCVGDSVYFYDSSTINNTASVTTFFWAFNDGGATSALQDPPHFYSAAGSYNVTLLATSNQNCSNAISKNVHVYASPIANFTVNDVCLSDSAIFVNTSLNPSSGSITGVSWSFGDGSSNENSAFNTQHLFNLPGTYAISLITLSSNLGCADTMVDSIAVYPMPVAAFTSAEVCLGESVSFSDSSYVVGGSNVTQWTWNFGDGSSSSVLQNPTRTYQSAGAYSVSLVVSTNDGCKDTANSITVIHPRPSAQFVATNVCKGDSTSFISTSVVPPGSVNDSVTFWKWTLDGASQVVFGSAISQLYANAGKDTVQLMVGSSFGCSDSITKVVVVNPLPVPAFTSTDTAGCEPWCVYFYDSSTIETGAIIQWNWGLGDGTSMNTNSFNHCYNAGPQFQTGLYTVILNVVSDSGCVSSVSKNDNIIVYPKPVASFSISPSGITIINPEATITNLTQGADSWRWQFGDGDTIGAITPLPHIYPDTGSYNVNLIASTNYGCADTAYHEVYIAPDFAFYIPSAFSPNGDGINDTFTGKGIYIKDFEMFIFDRWGNLVYHTEDILKPWDGKVSQGSETALNDIYVYSIKVTDFIFNKYSYKGTVTIVK